MNSTMVHDTEDKIAYNFFWECDKPKREYCRSSNESRKSKFEY